MGWDRKHSHLLLLSRAYTSHPQAITDPKGQSWRSRPACVTDTKSTTLPKPPKIDRAAYKVKEVAIALGIDKTAVYDLIRVGKLRYIRLAGGTMIIPATALHDFLNGTTA